MKRIKKLAIMLAAVTALVLLPDSNAVKADAEEPVTYSVKYVSSELGWRYVTNNDAFFDETNNGRELYYLLQNIKDGDLVVVYNEIGSPTPLDLGNVNLSNLTFMLGTQNSMVYAGSVTDCYVLDGSVGTVNCNVKNAYVYDTVVFNFNANIENLTLYVGDPMKSTVGCSGTVGHLNISYASNNQSIMDLYNFQANSMVIKEGKLTTPSDKFQTSGEYTAAPSTAAPAPSSGTTSSSSASSDYDDVPKTGQNNLYLWLILASAVCFTGSLALKRSNNK